MIHKVFLESDFREKTESSCVFYAIMELESLKETIHCPKCGAERAGDEPECARCGVIFSKLTAQDFRPQPVRKEIPEPPAKKIKLPVSWIIVALLLVAGFGYFLHDRLEQKHIAAIGPVEEEPVQTTTDAPAMHRFGFEIQPVARYVIRARVLSTERYLSGRWAELSPVDFALGWGPMSDHSVIGKLHISQGNRWYHYSWQGDAPADPALMAGSSANTHIVPADDDLKSKLLKVRAGEIVALRGYLINVRHPDGGFWNSSLTREDRGDHACELMWVEDVVIE